MLTPWKRSYDKLRQHIKKQRHYFAKKGPSSQSYGFSSSHVWMWELEHKESWVPKNWCFWTEVLEKTLESPLDCKEIKPVHPKGNQCWIFIGRTDAEAPIFWPPDAKNWLIGIDPDTGKDWGQEEKGRAEGEMVGWHHWLDGLSKLQELVVDREAWHAAIQALAESGKTEWLNWAETYHHNLILEHFLHPKRKSCNTVASYYTFLQVLGTWTINLHLLLLFCPLWTFQISGIKMWPLGTDFFQLVSSAMVQPCCSMYQVIYSFLLVDYNNTFFCVYHSYFFYSSFDRYGLFPFCSYYE